MRVDIITLFPEVFEGLLQEGIFRIAQEKKLAVFRLLNLRDFSTDKHRKVDSPPYGGGAGMVIQAEPIFHAVEYVRRSGSGASKLVFLTPSGKPYNQTLANTLTQESGLILLCGHYEGIDERVITGLQPLEISIGDYVLSGGEIPAMAILDSVVRLIPDVVGDPASVEEESFARGLLEYPHYTRPAEFQGMEVPDVLLSGNHAQIQQWRKEQAYIRTEQRRPDLLVKGEKR